MKRSWLAHAFIVSFLLVQLLLPLRGLLTPSSRTGEEFIREFSWNMYAYSLQTVFRYRLVQEDGTTLRVGVEREFNVPREFFRVIRRDRLARFHAYLCDHLKQRGVEGRLLANVRTSPRASASRRLVQRGVDICTAENFGVAAE